ncbi:MULTISPECIES: hypothetical protein [Dyella]|uniref:hypothetical protein n=1 Tax=Dyella TaxID=231454 RepID=UPI0013F178B1|nr:MULTISPECIES: hypothetical protein [Dyella]
MDMAQDAITPNKIQIAPYPSGEMPSGAMYEADGLAVDGRACRLFALACPSDAHVGTCALPP